VHTYSNVAVQENVWFNLWGAGLGVVARVF
jgi:hypothetical protein